MSKSTTVADLIEALSAFDDDMPVSVFTSGGDYGTPSASLVMKNGKPSRVTITAEEDE